MSRSVSNLWTCFKCNEDFGSGEFMKHIKKVHKIKTKKGKRREVLHLDGPDFYVTTYEWSIGRFKFGQSIRSKRTAEEARLWH